jgi:FHS family L-fucose permease-like MFS transporter
MKQDYILGLQAENTVHFISLYWGGLMIGRWAGAVTVFNFKGILKNIMMVLLPLLAFVVLTLVNYIKGSPVDAFIDFLPLVILLIVGFFLGKEKPARTLILFSIMAIIMMTIGLLTTGKTALYCFLSGGLFCSIMWPCIFSLSIAGLGKYTNQGSALLIMMILGGAIIPPLQGFIADKINIHVSYIVPLIGFIYLAYYGWSVRGILRKQGIDYDAQTTSH